MFVSSGYVYNYINVLPLLIKLFRKHNARNQCHVENNEVGSNTHLLNKSKRFVQI